MRDEPDVDAMPAASPCGQVRLFTMVLAVRRRDHWITTEAEITVVLGIAERPAADPWGECAGREDSCRGARQGGCLGARQGGLCRRLLDEEGSGRFRRGAAICPDGSRNGDLLNLSDRNHPAGQ